MDPLAEKYHPWSPFNYVKNNPLKYIDPNGEDLELAITKNKQGNHSEIQIKSVLNLTIVGNISDNQINALKATYSKSFSGQFPVSGDYGKGYESARVKVSSALNVNVVDKIDKAKKTDHIMILVNDVPGKNIVGYGDIQGAASAVEKNTVKNSTFDEVASHELGHNLGLDHKVGGLMNETVKNGESGVTSKELKQIYGGAPVLPAGKTTLYNGPDNRKDAEELLKRKSIN